MNSKREDEVAIAPADGLPVMKVGAWSEDKHVALSRYVDAALKAREKWSYASFIDLFSGPGRVMNRDSKTISDGGVLSAWRMSKKGGAPFNEIYIADADVASVEACATRLRSTGAHVQAWAGKASETVDWVLDALPAGLHFAFLDPFNIEHLDFEIIRKLASRRSIDILIHFSVMDVQRNIGADYNLASSRLDAAAPGWRNNLRLDALPKRAQVGAYLEYWESLVTDLTKMQVAQSKPLFVNTNKGPLYRLIHLSRHPLATKLWNDAAMPSSQQRSLPGF
ncbi:three-Cys-motif partner protein TcmP [Burkholderia multivorans]|uniref:three-Cys-motif partner protein TcmP n=1 Tax=Burkholderia multivorans TaxID=87883 RepID=UPI002B24899B|nr:three-Cys-motif partner protein TcmP [Burkholderia multivorans]MEB2524661.1 three-Cys-motif partner protein TcmP [Burkholderia multivorans]MEB2591555.1 three-Cys-motif partner protein TcmP [Burkholderia multivorans]